MRGKLVSGIILASIFTSMFAMAFNIQPVEARFYPGPGKGAATIYVTPQYNNFTYPPTTNGTWFTVNVRIANATFVAYWQVELWYNKEFLHTSHDNVSLATDHIFPPGSYVRPVDAPWISSYNATHNFLVDTAGAYGSVEYNATDAGLITVKFQIIKVPALGQTLSSLFYLAWFPEAAVVGTWTVDGSGDMDNDLTLYDGYYQITNDWWPMFRRDLTHSGHSYSTGPSTNRTLWTCTIGEVLFSSPAVADGRVYVGSNDRNVYCLNASTGARIWNYTAGDAVTSCPAVADGRVYIGSDDYNVYCLNASTGAFIWSYTTGLWVDLSSPAVADGKVYIGSVDGNVYCLNASTGAFIWSYTTGYMGVSSCPAVADDRIYVGADNNNVYCLNASTGAFIWSYTTGSNVESSPAVVDGKVYVGSFDGNVYCLNASTGAFIWSYTTSDWVYSSPAVVDGKVYVGSMDSNVYCLNASTGAFIWSYTTGNLVISSPAVADGKVYVGSVDANVYCLNSSNGAYIWSYRTGEAVWSSPAIADSRVYVGSRDHRVYAFGLTHGIAVTEVSPFKTVVGQALNLRINVTVANRDYTETFNVTVYADATEIETREITLTSNNSTTLTFTWDTTSWIKGNYAIKAYAWPVPGEEDNTDNTRPGGNVIVAMIGDITGPTQLVPDGKVDGRDVALVAKYFGSISGYPPNVDIYEDGKIDGRDIAIVSKYFGTVDP